MGRIAEALKRAERERRQSLGLPAERDDLVALLPGPAAATRQTESIDSATPMELSDRRVELVDGDLTGLYFTNDAANLSGFEFV